MFILLATIVLIVAYLSFCFRIVKENERGIKVFLGKPGKTFKSGLRFIWWPLEKIVIYPTTQQEIEIKNVRLITKAKRQEKGEEYGSAEITLDVSLYFFWPDNLLEPVVNGPHPGNKEEIFNFFEEAISDALRSAAGKRTWQEVVQERKKLTKDVCNALKGVEDKEDKAESEKNEKDEISTPFKKAGISNLYVVIKGIELPSTLREAITAPEVARLKKEARTAEGEGEKGYKTKVGEGNAAARKSIFDVIRGQEGGLAMEALLTLREMAQGTSNTILFGLPPQLYETLAEAMGGKRPEELFKLLPKKQQEDLIKKLTATAVKREGKK